MGKRHYSDEDVRQALYCIQMREDHSTRAVAASLGIPLRTLQYWRQHRKDLLTSGTFPPFQRAKRGTYARYSDEDVRHALECVATRGDLPLRTIAETLGMPLRTLQEWSKNGGRPTRKVSSPPKPRKREAPPQSVKEKRPHRSRKEKERRKGHGLGRGAGISVQDQFTFAPLNDGTDCLYRCEPSRKRPVSLQEMEELFFYCLRHKARLYTQVRGDGSNVYFILIGAGYRASIRLRQKIRRRGFIYTSEPVPIVPPDAQPITLPQ